MSEEKEENSIVKYCVHCGAEVLKDQAYCPKCGKLVLKLKQSSDKIQQIKAATITQKKEIPSRTCSNCGSIIKSTILEQCPICNAKLEKIPKEMIAPTITPAQKKTGFIFSNKKLVPEQKFILKKDIWNLREGVAVFGNSLLAYVIIRFLMIFLIFIVFDPSGTGSVELNIYIILLYQIPDIIFGVYPLWYIYSKKHDIKKLGIYLNFKSLLKAIFIGLIGALVLILLDNLSSLITQFLYDTGIDFFNIFEYLQKEALVIKNADLLWVILLCLLLILSIISTELVFRGVLHNSLKAQFESNITGRVSIILIVALIYAGLFLLFSWPEGIYFFIFNFLIFIILGILFEVNGNLLNS
ncbi:MAG: zinc-ribbon domain-containing protein, partial [Candidatus Thorarchaeota archaeon]